MLVRVLVYNVRGFQDGRARVAAVVDRSHPDVVLLNESDGRLGLRRFAKAVGMRAVGDPWSPFRRRVKNAVLVRPPWRVVEHRLHRFQGSTRMHPRGALLALIERDGHRLWGVSVHLGLHPLERLRHAGELAGVLRDLDGPVMIGGDLNETPERRAASFLADRYADAWLLGGGADGATFPAQEPVARIDYLFVTRDVRVEGAIVPQSPEVRVASDHRPLVVEISIPDS